MQKSKAIELLGGTVSSAAGAIGINPQAISQWPDELPPRLVDRVIAAIARERMGVDALLSAANHQQHGRTDATTSEAADA